MNYVIYSAATLLGGLMLVLLTLAVLQFWFTLLFDDKYEF